MLVADSLLSLPLDIKINIANKTADIYLWFVINDLEFRRFSTTDRLNYIIRFTVIQKLPKHTKWILFGKLNSINDQPAIIYSNGRREWYQNDKYHRDNDQPAIIYSNGTQEWYQNGNRHRDNDQPAYIHANGKREWYQNNKWHRDNDQPAIIHPNGSLGWYQNGNIHRDNVIIYADGK